MSELRVGVCGVGTVGGGVLDLLRDNAQEVESRAGRRICIVHVGARSDRPGRDLEGYRRSHDVFEVISDPEVDVVLELMGGVDVARELVLAAIGAGKHVVTANKALIAEHGAEVFAAAARHGVSVHFEAAIAGGIPIVKSLREGLAANRIDWLAGIINGTSNYILSEMFENSREFSDVLVDAQRLGYAEADPTFDVEGIDAAHKLVILTAMAFGAPLDFDACYTEGITAIEPQDLEFADELGFRIKHLGIARRADSGIEMRVHPTLVPKQRLIANVDGVMNAVLVHGNAVGPTMYYGAGAGAGPTASAVVADLVDLARQSGQQASVPALAFSEPPAGASKYLSVDDASVAYYLRMSALDKPGTLSHITQLLSEADISIEAVSQKARGQGSEQGADGFVPIVLITSVTREHNLREVVSRIEQLDSIVNDVKVIRIESLS